MAINKKCILTDPSNTLPATAKPVKPAPASLGGAKVTPVAGPGKTWTNLRRSDLLEYMRQQEAAKQAAKPRTSLLGNLLARLRSREPKTT